MVSRPPRPTGAWAAKQWDRKYGGVQSPKVEPATTPTTTTAPVVRPPTAGKGTATTGVSAGAQAPTTPATTTPSWTAPTTPATETWQAPVAQASQPTNYWDAAVTTEGRQSQTADPKQDSRVQAGTHYVGFGGAILPYSQNYQSADLGGIVTGNEQYDTQTAAQKYQQQQRAAELNTARFGSPGDLINRDFTKHNAGRAAQQIQQSEAQQRYNDLMSGNWSPERQAGVDDLFNAGMTTYDEYMEGAHDRVPDGQGGYQSQGNTRVGYRPDGGYGWMDQRDYPGWTQEMGQQHYAPKLDDLNAARSQGYDVTNMGRDQAAQIAQQAPQQQMPQRGQPQQQQQQMPQWGSAPQGTMAGNFGWGAGLGGPPQQQMMPQWGQPQQPQGAGGMPQWGGAPQQQAMPQWGQMMQQQPMGGPMAGMEAARMGGGAMQQMGGGSPWASMWGDPFAGRQMTTDPNSPAMGGLPQMNPTDQLMMQMMGGGGGMSGGFGAGGGSSGGGGMSGAGQTGGDPYGSLASILALFAGGGGGGGGGGGASYNPMYGGLPRNGLYYADLMGAGG